MMLNPKKGRFDNVVERLLLVCAVEAKRLKQLVIVLLGEGYGDAVVVVLHQLHPQEDEWFGCCQHLKGC